MCLPIRLRYLLQVFALYVASQLLSKLALAAATRGITEKWEGPYRVCTLNQDAVRDSFFNFILASKWATPCYEPRVTDYHNSHCSGHRFSLIYRDRLTISETKRTSFTSVVNTDHAEHCVRHINLRDRNTHGGMYI